MRSYTPQNVSFFTRRGGFASYPRAAISFYPSKFRHASTSHSPNPRRRAAYWLSIASCFGLGTTAGWFLGRTPAPAIDQQSFTPFTLQSKERVSSTASIFTLVPASAQGTTSKEDPYEALWQESLWSVQAKQPQLQIARDYTPLPPSVIPATGPVDHAALRILIRHEVNGEMSGYLHRLPLGTTVDLRGPHKNFEFEQEREPASIIFCAGGTGIAPALQCAYALLSSRDVQDLPRMHILWASRRREDCEGGVSDTLGTHGWLGSLWPFGTQSPRLDPSRESITRSAVVEELEALKKLFGGRLTVDYFVDEEARFIGQRELQISPALESSVSDETSISPPLVLVSGPDGFIKYLAGPKVVRDGLEVQGPLGGLLADVLREKSCIVWKL